MQIKKQLSPCQILVEKTFSKDDLNKLAEEILKVKREEINIPGFRPGKAPLDKVREILESTQKWEELMGVKLQEDAIADWIKENERETGEIVKITGVKTVKDEPLTLEYTFEYFPRIKGESLKGKYKELKISGKQKLEDLKVSDKEVEEALLELQKRRAILKPVTDPLDKDIYAFLKVSNLIDGKKVDGEKEGRDLFQWGIEQYGKDFDEKTKGMKEGETRIIKVDDKDNKNFEKLKGVVTQKDNSAELKDKKELELNVGVEKIFVSEAPEIDDEFAKSLGNFKNLTELKSNLKEGMALEKLYDERDKRKELFLQALIAAIEIEVPDSIVKRSALKYKRDFEARLNKEMEAYPGMMNKDETEEKKEKFHKIFEEKAKKELKLQRILEAIALEEKIMPSEEEVEKEIKKILSSFPSPKEAKNTLGDGEEFKSRVLLSVCFEQTLKFLEKENNLMDNLEKEIERMEGERHHHHHHDEHCQH